MIAVAFTLGLFGSLHCLGMCGPLAFSLMPGVEHNNVKAIIKASAYNFGRVISYMGLGILIGVFGGLFNFSGFQKPLTIAMGIFLIVLFFFSMDLERLLFKSKNYQNLYTRFSKMLSVAFNSKMRSNTLAMGMLNGLIPCGLVYLAMAGALATGSPLLGARFMFFFGMGTFPAMFFLLAGTSILNLRSKLKFRKVFAFLQLFLGIFLIYRALAIDVPMDLSLLQSMANPILCH